VWVLVSTWLVTSFCHCLVSGLGAWWWQGFSGKTSAAHISCVWFWELMKQELFAVFQPLLVVKVFAE